jgi:hypothetical protein
VKTNAPLDALGKEIRVGDTVVYSVKTREGGLQVGEVVGIIPYTKEITLPNPAHDPSQPTGYRIGDPNSRFLREYEWFMKLKVKTTRSVYDTVTRQYMEADTTKTLDTPSRFAIVEKP